LADNSGYLLSDYKNLNLVKWAASVGYVIGKASLACLLRPFREENAAICAFIRLRHGWCHAVNKSYFIVNQLFR
jgi:hypothetical protein